MRHLLCGFAAVVIWGIAPVAVKWLVGSLPGAAASTAIYGIAACLTLPWLLAAVRQGRVAAATWVHVIAIGVMLTSAFNLLMALAAPGIRGTSIGAIVALEPLMVALIAAGLSRRRPDLSTLSALVVSLAGVWLLIYPAADRAPDTQDAAWAVALILLGALLWSSAVVLAARLKTVWPPLQTSMVMVCCGSLPFLLAVPLLPWWPAVTWSWQAGWGVLFMALGVTVLANVLWLRAVRAVGPTAVSLLINVSPLTTVALAVFWLDEPWNMRQLAGALLILAAMSLTPILHAIRRRRLDRSSCP